MPKKGYKPTKKHKKNISNSNKGKTFSKTHKKNLSKAIKGIQNTLGFHQSDKTKKQISKKLKGRKLSQKHIQNLTGKNNHSWKNGISFEPYPIKWTKKLKQTIRKRDNFTCQKCNTHQNNLKRKLDIHHIDYNKQNCNHKNLISLCNSCHIKTNYRRNYWTTYFQTKIQQIYNII